MIGGTTLRISSTPALATVTGAVALTLLLAGCSGGGDDSSETGASSSDRATATADAAEESTGEFTLPADCDAAGVVLGDLVTGRTLVAETSTVGADEASCTWTSETDGSRVAFLATVKELDQAGMDAEVPTDENVDGLSLEEVDDERADAFGGRAFVATADADSPVVGGGSIVLTPHGLLSVIVAAPAGTTVPLDPARSLDVVFDFVD
jgi:hypothetical protein